MPPQTLVLTDFFFIMIFQFRWDSTTTKPYVGGKSGGNSTNADHGFVIGGYVVASLSAAVGFRLPNRISRSRRYVESII